MTRIAPTVILICILLLAIGAGRRADVATADGHTSIYLPIVESSRPASYKLMFRLDTNDSSGVYVTEADVSAETFSNAVRPLSTITNTVPYWGPTWSPDAEKVVYRFRTIEDALVVADADGRNASTIVDVADIFGFGVVTIEDKLAWSPNAAQVAFATSGQFVDIFTAATDSVSVVNLTQESAATTRDNRDPDWSPVGDSIIFASRTLENNVLNGAIESIAADGSSRKPLYGPFADRTHFVPSYSPDGSQIAFVEMTAPYSTLSGQLIVMDADGNNVTAFAAPFPLQTGLHWSPDGTRLAFVGEADNGTIAVSSVALASASVQTSLLPADVNSFVSWSYDGTSLVFDAPESDISRRNLYRFDLNSGITTPLTTAANGERYSQPTFSPQPAP